MNKKIIITGSALILASGVTLLCAQEPAPKKGNQGNVSAKSAPAAQIKKSKAAVQREEVSTTPKARVSKQPKIEDLTQLQQNARDYRSEGVRAQAIGNIDSARVYFQKAIVLDPLFAAPYNDLGIIYEEAGDLDKAQSAYLNAIKVDPNYLSAYSNLALLCEQKRDLNGASYYWQKRIELSSGNDPWLEKAKEHLENIQLVTGVKKDNSKEEQIMGLLKEVKNNKATVKPKIKTASEGLFEKAQEYYKNGDYAQAIKEALDASQLDPANKEIEKFIDTVRLQALTK